MAATGRPGGAGEKRKKAASSRHTSNCGVRRLDAAFFLSNSPRAENLKSALIEARQAGETTADVADRFAVRPRAMSVIADTHPPLQRHAHSCNDTCNDRARPCNE